MDWRYADNIGFIRFYFDCGYFVDTLVCGPHGLRKFRIGQISSSYNANVVIFPIVTSVKRLIYPLIILYSVIYCVIKKLKFTC
jgi:hypothetical protein